jgi:hypothetical protein
MLGNRSPVADTPKGKAYVATARVWCEIPTSFAFAQVAPLSCSTAAEAFCANEWRPDCLFVALSTSASVGSCCPQLTAPDEEMQVDYSTGPMVRDLKLFVTFGAKDLHLSATYSLGSCVLDITGTSAEDVVKAHFGCLSAVTDCRRTRQR